jgi:DNA polymerase-3 subunit delta
VKTKRDGIGIAELTRQLASGAPAPIYLVVGAEAFLRETAVVAIREAVLGPDAASGGAFNADLVHGDETDAREILGLCGTLPVFAERRLVVVRDAGALRVQETERLLPYLDAPVETTCLVLTGEKVDGRIMFFKALKKTAVTVDCESLDARALPVWVQEQAAALGLRLDTAACEALQEASSGNLSIMRRELEKLALYVMPRTTVTVSDVYAVQGADTGGTAQDLLDALRNKDRGQALRILAKVLEAGEPPLKLLGFLAACWRNEWRARAFSEELSRAVEAFRETDSRLKSGGRGRERWALERLVFALCRGRDATSPRAFAPGR